MKIFGMIPLVDSDLFELYVVSKYLLLKPLAYFRKQNSKLVFFFLIDLNLKLDLEGGGNKLRDKRE